MRGTNNYGDRGESPARPATTEAVTGDASQPDPAAFKQAMDLIRRRRKYFFATIIAYMPLMWAANKISPTFRSMAITFSFWVVVLFITALYSAIVRCPRCGNYFHMNGMSLLYLRRCLHCQLHVRTDTLLDTTQTHHTSDNQPA